MEITKTLKFEASHRLLDPYTSRCKNIHGHSYVVELTFNGDIQKDGMLVDFTLVKESFNHIIDAFDHSFVINKNDTILAKLAPYLSSRYIIFPDNPTAENMAQYFFEYIHYAIPLTISVVKLTSVTVWETVTSKATCTSCTPERIPVLACSPSIVSDWKQSELTLFKDNNGSIQPQFNLITEIDNLEESDGILEIQATLQSKNCK